MTCISKRTWIAGLGLAWLTSFSLSSAQAQSYPQRPIKAIVPYAAGGFSDQASRIIAEAMSQRAFGRSA
jgi:tripartite-type tricarboxylate transporter receptor subunit TctC